MTASGLSARHVGELARELDPLARGARVRALEPLPPRDLLLVVEGEGGTVRRLRFSADPEAPRFHLQIEGVERHAGPAGPFYRRARDELAGRTLLALEQLEEDRIVRATVGDPEPRAALVLELAGRNANLVLLDGSGTVLAALVVPGAGSPAAERLAPGRPYARPGGRGAPRASPPLLEHLPDPPPRTGLAALAPLSWRVEASLGRQASERTAGEQRRAFEQKIERKLAGLRQQLLGLAERARLAGEADRVRRDGELLLAHLARARRGLEAIELPEGDDPAGPPRRIELDRRLSPQENAERLFARYKKLQRTAERLPEERALALAQSEHLEALLARAREPEADVLELEAEAIAAGFLQPPQENARRGARKVEPRLPYTTFRGLRGGEIRVGRNASDNDALTFRHSHGNDLWFHTSGSPGSHVVLRVPRGREADPEELLDAAHLAVHFSPLRGARKAEVHVAPCKQVKKPRRAPGLVDVSGGKVRAIRVEPERLRRLLDTRPRAGTPEERDA